MHPSRRCSASSPTPSGEYRQWPPALGRRITVTDVETSSEGAVTSWKWSTRFVLPVDYRTVVTRAEHVPNRRILETHSTPTRDVDAFTFEPAGNGTRLTYYAECSSPIPLLEKLGILLAAKGKSYGRQLEDILAEVKRQVEAAHPPTAQPRDAS